MIGKYVTGVQWPAIAAGLLLMGMEFGASAADEGADEDAEFLAKAVMVSRQEVNDARGAARLSNDANLRATAQAIESDHLKAEQVLANLAREKRATPVDEGSSQFTSEMIGGSIGSDAEGIAALLQVHEEAVALFHQEAVRGMDPQVKRFAQTTLPTLQRRLEALKSLQLSTQFSD